MNTEKSENKTQKQEEKATKDVNEINCQVEVLEDTTSSKQDIGGGNPKDDDEDSPA